VRGFGERLLDRRRIAGFPFEAQIAGNVRMQLWRAGSQRIFDRGHGAQIAVIDHDGIERVEDPELRAKLAAVIRDDIVRMDRLIGDISEAARTDAELARAHFRPVDLGPLIEQLVQSWEKRRETGSARVAFARPRKDTAVVMGKPDRLARALNAILDNAISFSPANGLIEIAVSRVGDDVLIRIDDEGPGVPAEAREAIFNRFHSVRPDTENFGRHSGLGLAIAQAIVNGHDGEIDVQDRDDAPSGARFTIRLPAAGNE